MTPLPSSRLIDPVHFFTERGVSVLTYDELTKRIATLEADLEKSQRQLKLAVKRLRENNISITS